MLLKSCTTTYFALFNKSLKVRFFSILYIYTKNKLFWLLTKFSIAKIHFSKLSTQKFTSDKKIIAKYSF